MKKGEIYYADFGKVLGSEQGGIRPVLILTDKKGEDVLVAALTSKQKKKLPVHIELSSEETGLKQPSLLLLEQIGPVSAFKLKSKLGYLTSDKRWEEIKEGLKVSLGL